MSMYGLSSSDWQQVLRFAVEPLKRHGAKIFLFGSRATGKHRKFSDVDLCYESDRPLDPVLLANIIANLEGSNLPVRVEVVDFKETPESFRENILTQRIAL